MNKIFNLTANIKAAKDSDDNLVISGYASTPDTDRIGDVVLSEAWTRSGGLDNFKKNPIILFNHNHNNPIGKATKVESTKAGLELEAKISKAAPGGVYELIKDGVLGTFSVGFIVKDAEYVPETDGFKIKDAELLEVSVVTVPMNQAATFSLAKSFESAEDYEDFKKTFTNRVDLASQSLAGSEGNPSSVARNALGGAQKGAHLEINMDEKQLEALARKVAEETAEKIAKKQAEEKAAEELQAEAARKAADEKAKAESRKQEEINNLVTMAVQTGSEKLLADFKAEMGKKDAQLEEVVSKFKKDLEEKNEELAKIRESKRVFSDRTTEGGVKGIIKTFSDDFLCAHMLGVITRKGFNTDFARNLLQKAGIDYVTNAPDIDQEVSQRIEKEIQRELRVARLFREIPVNGAATVLPIQPDTGLADWAINATSGNLENRGATDNTYKPKQVILNAYRLVSSTFMDNDVDEQVLVNLMPMLVEGVSRAHARTVERTILIGDGFSSPNIGGLTSYAATYSGNVDLDETSVAAGDNANLTADLLLGARKSMGKYGIRPEELAYIVSQEGYYDLLSDSKFQTLDEVGSDLAVRVTGTLGAVYGTPVIVSDEFEAAAAGKPLAFAVFTRNYVIPRLRGVMVEQDYEVMNQRRVIVASQSLGFEEILPGDGSGTEPCVKITYTA